MKRDLINYLGQKVGVMELSDGTPEEIWEERLSVYKEIPTSKESKIDFSPITQRQLRQALFLKGVDANMITDAINTLSDPAKTLTMLAWEYTTEFNRADPAVDAVRQIIQWTDEMTDDLWLMAGGL